MSIIHRIMIGLSAIVLVIAITACRPAAANQVPPDAANQVLSTVSETATPQPVDAIVWGRVPHCNCLTNAALSNVAHALEDANLAVKLQEQSPRDGWLYFAVTFDPRSITFEQVRNAMSAGGAEVINGSP